MIANNLTRWLQYDAAGSALYAIDKLSIVVTINSSQGQNYKYLGLDWSRDCIILLVSRFIKTLRVQNKKSIYFDGDWRPVKECCKHNIDHLL